MLKGEPVLLRASVLGSVDGFRLVAVRAGPRFYPSVPNVPSGAGARHWMSVPVTEISRIDAAMMVAEAIVQRALRGHTGHCSDNGLLALGQRLQAELKEMANAPAV
jgi:hypothetical protein